MLRDRRLRDREAPCEIPTTAFPCVGNGLQKTEPGRVREGFRNFDDVLRRHHGRRPLRYRYIAICLNIRTAVSDVKGWGLSTHDRPRGWAGRRGPRDTASRERA